VRIAPARGGARSEPRIAKPAREHRANSCTRRQFEAPQPSFIPRAAHRDSVANPRTRTPAAVCGISSPRRSARLYCCSLAAGRVGRSRRLNCQLTVTLYRLTKTSVRPPRHSTRQISCTPAAAVPKHQHWGLRRRREGWQCASAWRCANLCLIFFPHKAAVDLAPKASCTCLCGLALGVDLDGRVDQGLSRLSRQRPGTGLLCCSSKVD
jgi:hypothetical protein